MNRALKGQNLNKSYKRKMVLNGIDISVSDQNIVGILGPNGTGKTTAFYIMSGLLKADQGTVVLNGQDISHLALHQRAKIGIGYLPQESSIFENLSVEDNLLIAAEIAFDDKQQQLSRVEELLMTFNIEQIRTRKGIYLSGGERRRCEIARALVAKPHFLLLDEPFAGIDPLALKDIQKVILLLKNMGLGILITDHNVKETLDICDFVYVLKDGKILKEGLPQDIAKDEEVTKHYLGEAIQL